MTIFGHPKIQLKVTMIVSKSIFKILMNMSYYKLH